MLIRRIVTLLSLVAVVGIGVNATQHVRAKTAADQQPDAAIAEGYKTRDTVVRGTLVNISLTQDHTAEIATRENASRLLGVVTQLPLIALSDPTTTIQVVTSGLAYALVSDSNGTIKRGDHVGVSSLAGIGAKAVTSSQIVGVAHDDFSAAQLVKEHTVRGTDGRNHTIHVGLLLINVNPMYYQAPNSEAALVPGFLQQFANSLAGNSVAPLRVIVAIIVFLAGLGAIGILFYSSVRFSITAIGRNPLSAQAVHKSLVEIAIISGFILLVTLIAVYLILVI